MRKVILFFAIFLFLSGLVQSQESFDEPAVKEQLLSGLDQLENLMLGMQNRLFSLQYDVEIGQQIIQDMTSIQEAQAVYLNQLRREVDEMDKLDKAKSQYIILLQNRQKNYRLGLAIGIPAGIIVGVVGGVLIHSALK